MLIDWATSVILLFWTRVHYSGKSIIFILDSRFSKLPFLLVKSNYFPLAATALNLQGVHLNVNLVSNLSTVSLTALGITDWTNYLWRNKYSFLAVDIPVHTPLYSCLIIDFRCIPKGRISKRLCVFCQLWVINLGNHSLYGEQALTGTPSSVLRGLHINCCW